MSNVEQRANSVRIMMTGRIRISAVVTALLVAVTLSAGTAPPVVHAQTTGLPYRIGLLAGGSSNTPATEAFRQGLRDFGYVEGKNVVIHDRYAEGNVDRLPDLAAQLVALKVDVIAAGPTPPAKAAMDASKTIPIVMLGAADPVELGLVTSLARPGGNITGLAWSVNLEIIEKELELLKEAMPKVGLIGVLWNPANPALARAMPNIKRAAQSLGVQLQLLEVRRPDDFDEAFAAMAKRRTGAVLVAADALFVVHRTRLVELETQYRLLSMHGLRQNVEAGSIMSYGPSAVTTWRRGAYFVDKILRGTSPADLPVEQPANYELIINAKAAKARGLTIPQSLLLRADYVIR